MSKSMQKRTKVTAQRHWAQAEEATKRNQLAGKVTGKTVGKNSSTQSVPRKENEMKKYTREDIQRHADERKKGNPEAVYKCEKNVSSK